LALCAELPIAKVVYLNTGDNLCLGHLVLNVKGQELEHTFNFTAIFGNKYRYNKCKPLISQKYAECQRILPFRQTVAVYSARPNWPRSHYDPSPNAEVKGTLPLLYRYVTLRIGLLICPESGRGFVTEDQKGFPAWARGDEQKITTNSYFCSFFCISVSAPSRRLLHNDNHITI